ncbi:MAG: hypothetical protein ACKO96_23895 [Flammeovirgaceae bacterium]
MFFAVRSGGILNVNMNDLEIEIQNLLKNPETKAFIELLVGSLLGRNLDQLENRELQIATCLGIFEKYILEYIETKHNKKLSFQLQNTSEANNFFTKFQELGEVYDEAYKAFFNDLKIHWQS